MNILLVAINSKYIHSNPAVYSLAAYGRKKLFSAAGAEEQTNIEIAEYTINQPLSGIMKDVYRRKPDLLLFSCYIWNVTKVEELVSDMYRIRPELDIWLGGPEVSFDAEDVLRRLPAVKGVICGEGEESFSEAAEAYIAAAGKADNIVEADDMLRSVPGLVFRSAGGEIVKTGGRKPLDMDDVRFPYESLEDFENRIVYYESSRGCPFRCSYCLSSVEKSLRFRSPELVKKELAFFLENDVPQVKFIDRTFNCRREHALEIWRFIKENDNGVTNFHFEIAGDLLDEDELELLQSMRPGQVQLEIGVQSTNRRTLEEINRPMDFEKLADVVGRLKSAGNIHLHLDLIAGLPFEGYESFIKSFNDVFSLRPEQLQLGFLKVLKGSPMESCRQEYGLMHTQAPPYEVLRTRWMSYDELIKLKAVENMLDVYYNSGQFTNTIELLLGYFESPFLFFDSLAARYESENLEMLNLSRNGRYEQLLNFGREYTGESGYEKLQEAMICDYYLRENAKNRPGFFRSDKVDKTFAKEFYSIEAREHRYLRGGRLDSDDPRMLRGLTHLEKLQDGYRLFDYTRRNPMDNNAAVMKIDANQ